MEWNHRCLGCRPGAVLRSRSPPLRSGPSELAADRRRVAISEMSSVHRWGSTPPVASGLRMVWEPSRCSAKRRGWDSNPRGLAPAGFQDRCIEPLCHPSSWASYTRPRRKSGETPLNSMSADGLRDVSIRSGPTSVAKVGPCYSDRTRPKREPGGCLCYVSCPGDPHHPLVPS